MQETISNQQAINKQRYHYNDYTLTLEYDPETCFNSTCLMEKGTIVYAKTSMSISPELASELEISYYTASSSIEQASQLINSYIATQKLDTLAMQNIITTLNSVSHITPISIPLLQNFLDNPTSCDLRDLTEKLNYSLKNLNNIIELKSETNER